MNNQTITSAQQFNEERFTKIDIIKTKQSVAFVLNFLPGQHMKSHSHPRRELFLCVIEGNGTLLVDGKEFEVTKGDVIYCDPEEQIGFKNTSENKVSIYATMTKIAD
ncbi:cupin domain-containing protein [Pseudogracilibacillus sp. SO30301A]|uniref:cupin domain-containing protein n=1 Tax=Pseudogracilibacillus sp. SO30301A TaxID=3098291 RepID=UPI00300E6A14